MGFVFQIYRYGYYCYFVAGKQETTHFATSHPHFFLETIFAHFDSAVDVVFILLERSPNLSLRMSVCVCVRFFYCISLLRLYFSQAIATFVR